jgi:hypothetical protein
MHQFIFYSVTLLNPTEWEIFQRYIAVDKTVTVLAIKQDNNSTILMTNPQVCDDCIAMRLNAANFEKMDYKNAKIYVQKLSPGSDFETPGNGEGSNSGNNSDREDPEFAEVRRSFSSFVFTLHLVSHITGLFISCHSSPVQYSRGSLGKFIQRSPQLGYHVCSFWPDLLSDGREVGAILQSVEGNPALTLCCVQ